MAMLTVNGSAVPAPSALKVTVFDVSSGVNRNAAGNAVMDITAVKRRLEISWAWMSGEKLGALLNAVQGFFEAGYPDPQTGEMRTVSCYCSDRTSGMLRMNGSAPVWTDIKMTWTER